MLHILGWSDHKTSCSAVTLPHNNNVIIISTADNNMCVHTHVYYTELKSGAVKFLGQL